MAFSLLHLVVSVTVILTTAMVGNCQYQLQNTTFGECQPEKSTCRDCYLGLVRAVFGRDDNVFNLSRIFTPPTFDQPNSVIVNYRFHNECNDANDSCVAMDEIHTWFWAKSGAYLLHPLITFEFISLLFGNAQPLYEREVYVTLDADCYGASDDHMSLLTQRLKIYIQQQSFYPMMGDEYMPVAADSTTVVGILQDIPYTRRVTLSSEHILFFCPFSVTIIIVVLIIIAQILYASRGIVKFKNSVRAKLRSEKKATILAFTFVSLSGIVIFIGLDIAALIFNSPCSDSKVKGICEFSRLIHSTPPVLLALDLLALFFFAVVIIIALLFPKFSKLLGYRYQQKYHLNPDSKSDWKNFQRLRYYICALTVMGFVFSFLVHSPYITMAYLSDAHYATSVLVNYTIIFFTKFGVFQYTFRTHFSYGSLIYRRKKLTGVLIFVQTLLLYFLALSMILFYYYLPINNAVSNLPNEGIVVYQTALILLGAFITYKALFASKKNTNFIQQLSQQIKESEIACLKSKLKRKTITEGDKDLMRDKIVHLQEEITLMHVNNKLKCLTEGPNDPDDRTRLIKVARLKQQQSKILACLMSKQRSLEREIDDRNQPIQPEELNLNLIHDKEVENYRLQSEILDHLLTMKIQLEEKPIKEDDVEAIEQEISHFKEDIRQYLNKEKECLNQRPCQFPQYMYDTVVSGIEEEIQHLENACGGSQVSQPSIQQVPQGDNPRRRRNRHLCCAMPDQDEEGLALTELDGNQAKNN